MLPLQFGEIERIEFIQVQILLLDFFRNVISFILIFAFA